ncbi:hypothetical protein F5Y16DRAFT_421762 [Xylariaceae sp. FL0255]|nr:hypothetical protein F5Y16DRAFT_421762 [Xylariaceae sp. FL0255]
MSSSTTPAGVNLNDSRVPEMYAGLFTTWLLAVIVVGARFVTLRLNRNTIHLDDWIALAALAVIPKGTGRHIWALPEGAIVDWALGLFILEVAYTWTLAAVKFSSLRFYWRIFAARRSIRIPIWILTAMVTGWTVGIFLLTFLQCMPIWGFWEQFNSVNPPAAGSYRCTVGTHSYVLGVAIPNIITDAFVVLLPLPYVWTLKLRMSQRLALGGIFFLGFFVTAVSGIRLSYLIIPDTNDVDVTWDFVDPIVWSGVEANLAVVGCCLPSLKALLNLVLHGKRNVTDSAEYARSRTGTKKSTVLSSSRADSGRDEELGVYPTSHVHISGAKRPEGHGTFVRLSDSDSIGSRDDSGSTVELTTIPKNAITITRDIHVHTTKLNFGKKK